MKKRSTGHGPSTASTASTLGAAVSHVPFARSFDLLHPPGAEPGRPGLVAAGQQNAKATQGVPTRHLQSCLQDFAGRNRWIFPFSPGFTDGMSFSLNYKLSVSICFHLFPLNDAPFQTKCFLILALLVLQPQSAAHSAACW